MTHQEATEAPIEPEELKTQAEKICSTLSDQLFVNLLRGARGGSPTKARLCLNIVENKIPRREQLCHELLARQKFEGGSFLDPESFSAIASAFLVLSLIRRELRDLVSAVPDELEQLPPRLSRKSGPYAEAYGNSGELKAQG